MQEEERKELLDRIHYCGKALDVSLAQKILVEEERASYEFNSQGSPLLIYRCAIHCLCFNSSRCSMRFS